MKRKYLKKWIGISLVLSMLMTLVIPVSATSISPAWQRIFRGVIVTHNNIQEVYEKNETQLSKLIKAILENSHELNMDGEIVNVKGRDIESTLVTALKGLGVQLSRKNDYTSNTYLTEGNLNKSKDVIASFALFISDKLIAVNSKELIGSTYLGINPNTLKEDIKKSVWAKEIQEVQELGIDTNAHIKPQNPKLKQEELAALMLKYKAIGKDILTSNEAKKTGEVTLELEKGKVNCDEYTITLKKEWIYGYIDKLASTFKNDQELQDWILQQSSYKVSSKLSTEFKEELITEIDEFTKVLKSAIDQNVVMKIYINQKDEINKIVVEMKISNTTSLSEKVDIHAEIILGDGQSLTEGVKVSLKIMEDNKAYSNMSYDRVQTKINNEMVVLHQLKVSDESQDILTMTAKANYDETKTKDNVNLTFSMQVEDLIVRASATGDLAVNEKTLSVKANLDEIKLTVEESQDVFEVQLKGNISLGKIDAKDIQFDGSNVKMILKMSEEDLKKLSDQVEMNAVLIGMKLEKLLE
ncbi:MAG: hypothetical protein K0R69_2092 [Clostridia bacterium]|jgi:hypothetical protein|nr:hypothetical protein [Clostridia bacterium]